MPKYSSREMLFVLGCLTTCDPGNILQTIKVDWLLHSLKSDLFIHKFRLVKKMKFVAQSLVFQQKFVFFEN